jgi:hypothetical protein
MTWLRRVCLFVLSYALDREREEVSALGAAEDYEPWQTSLGGNVLDLTVPSGAVEDCVAGEDVLDLVTQGSSRGAVEDCIARQTSSGEGDLDAAKWAV